LSDAIRKSKTLINWYLQLRKHGIHTQLEKERKNGNNSSDVTRGKKSTELLNGHIVGDSKVHFILLQVIWSSRAVSAVRKKHGMTQRLRMRSVLRTRL
jgi:hypothetical protein